MEISEEYAKAALECAVDSPAKPVDASSLRQQLKKAEWAVQRSQKVAIIALADLAEHRDGYTGEHVLRVARLTHEMTRVLECNGVFAGEMDDRFMQCIGTASILHDVGKIGVPDRILFKPGPLTAEERRTMERHAVDGGAILKKAEALLVGSRQFELAGQIAVHHHERWDGDGYPSALAGEAIPLAARIVSVADVYDALISERPYKKAWEPAQALDYIVAQADKAFDRRVTAALQKVIGARAQAQNILWQPNMAIGQAQIDHDHRILLDLVNQVSSPATRADSIALEFVLDELLSYTANHFSREEALMQGAEYPDFVNHRHIHAAMIDEVRALQSRLIEPGDGLGDELHRFLGHWLIQHIMGEDRRYIPFVCPPGR